MAKKFDYQGARNAGYSDEEIMSHLSQSNPKFDVNSATQAGYSPQEINEHLASYSPKKSVAEKTGRIGTQLGIGALENALLPYEIAAAPLASKDAQMVEYRQRLFEDLEWLGEKKMRGDYDENDKAREAEIISQINDPEKAEPFVHTADVGVRGLLEKATGQDLKPQGILEKSAHWMGFLKNPKNAKELIKSGVTPKEIISAMTPGKTAARSLGAGTALEFAEQGKFGPLGTLASAITGDLIGGGFSGAVKGIANPKRTLAQGAALLSNSKSAIKNEMQHAASESGFTKDIGTLTNSNLVKMIQARLAASGLTGKPLEELRKKMTSEVVNEYKAIADELGEARFQSGFEAGEIAREEIKRAMDADKAIHTDLYGKFNKRIGASSKVSPSNALRAVMRMERDLMPGSVKSPEQQSVLNELSKLKEEFLGQDGRANPTSVQALVNNKRALQNFVDYELAGGEKNRFKKIIEEIDKDIISYSVKDPEAIKLFIQANKKFKDHTDKFRNSNINNIMTSRNPESATSKMNTVQGIRDMRNSLSNTPEGRKTFDNLARMKLDQILGDNLVNNVTEQLKSGRFLNALEKPKNRDLIKEILSPEAYKRLVRLHAHVSELAESANKFLNASQSATAAADLAGAGSILMGLYGLLSGNPWLASGAGGIIAARQGAKLLADEKFLKMAEEAIEAARKSNVSQMSQVAKKINSHVQEAIPVAVHEAGFS